MAEAGYADAVVVAAGQSRRMGGPDKLSVSLAGRPLLAWCVEALARTPAVGGIVVVAGADRVLPLSAAPWLRAVGAKVVAGGPRRQESTAAGLAATREDSQVVLVHDGARPFASPALIQAVAESALVHGAAIPVQTVADAVKRVDGDRVVAAVERDGLAFAQTPQGARRELLMRAFAARPADGADEFGDEAALLAAAGIEVVAVRGELENLKVTTPQDLEQAQAIARRRTSAAADGPVAGSETRVAHGRDRHPFGPDDGLALGGIVIADAPRLHGHSDGDAALHAVADAILGGAGLGDLGRLFPAGDPATRGVGSEKLVAGAVALAAAAGWQPGSVDLLIEGARPVLGGGRLDAMKGAVASLLGLEPDAVSVRASTGNLDGPTGAGRSIAADALVTLRRLGGGPR